LFVHVYTPHTNRNPKIIPIILNPILTINPWLKPNETSRPRAALLDVDVVLALVVVVLDGIEVVVAADEVGAETVALTEAYGKLNDVLLLARLQNCCARLSPLPRSVGHVEEIHDTILLVKFRLWVEPSE
jgi:hypothetical protein